MYIGENYKKDLVLIKVSLLLKFMLLTHSLIHHFETVPNSKKLQTTTEMWLLKDFKKPDSIKKHCGKGDNANLNNFTFSYNAYFFVLK